ncbi:protein NYNRIN-like [Camellia sinensis]|uniref:protein NYNRIN-like n=1 Tax=Camellia sinensis TaxID=4442 RepID=UPI00103686F7|nr:protein NYNRIN-like [Camellia sinensis]
MEKASNQLQKECPKCQSYIREDESCFEIDTPDWRQVYIDYLKKGTLLESPRDIPHLKRRARWYFLDQDKLYRRTTELSTKWVEAIPLKKATGPVVSNFIKENIICRFGVPNTILSDNGTPFINKYVKSLLETYQVKHHKSTPYYPKGNGQAEATNRTLIRILSKMIDEFGGTWSEQLIVALWAYRTSKRKPTQATPYSLVYGSEAVLPIELETPSARMALASGMVLEPRTIRLEALEEKHDRAAKVMERYHESIARAYNQTVVPRKFEEGDLVRKIVDPIMRGQPLPKFSPKWKGPYRVVQASSSGYYKLVRVEDGF